MSTISTTVGALDGTVRFINVNNLFRSYPRLAFLKVRRIAETRRGEMVVATNGGLITFSSKPMPLQRLRFFTTSPRSGDDRSLSSGTVLQALPTHDGHVFVNIMGGGVQEITDDGRTVMAASGWFGRLPSTNTTANTTFSPYSVRRTSAILWSSPRPNHSADPMTAICSWRAMAVPFRLHRTICTTPLWCRASPLPVCAIRATISRKPFLTRLCWKCQATSAV